MKTQIQILCFLIVSLILPSSAFATNLTYVYAEDTSGFTQGSNAGAISNVTTSYDTAGQFSWSYTVGKSGTAFSDGFYLVVNAGGNPTDSNNGLAILYGDLDTGNVSIYEYTSAGTFSFLDSSNFISQASNVINVSQTATDQTVSFTLDVAGLNALNIGPQWQGIQFDDELGYWFHPFVSAVYDVNGLGVINSIAFEAISFLDTDAEPTTVLAAQATVPEPSSVMLLLAGVAGIALRKKKASKA